MRKIWRYSKEGNLDNKAHTPLGATPRNQWHVSKTDVNLCRPTLHSQPLAMQAAPQHLTLDLGRTAIIVIDMQNDFCHPDGWLSHIGVDVTSTRQPIPSLQTVLPLLRQAHVPVVWVNWGNRPDKLNIAPSTLHVYNQDGVSIGIGDELPGTKARVLQAGSWSAQLVDELKIEPTDICIDKYAMSGFYETVLDSVLRNLQITTLLFAGVNADQCVLATLQDGCYRGYDCVFLEDCVATTSPDFCMQATIYNVKQCFGFVGSSHEIVERLSGN